MQQYNRTIQCDTNNEISVKLRRTLIVTDQFSGPDSAIGLLCVVCVCLYDNV